jgi:hypothetical protein
VSVLFAPAATVGFTKMWFAHRPISAELVILGCLFFLPLVCLRVFQCAFWVIVVTVLWAAQLVWFPLWGIGWLTGCGTRCLRRGRQLHA